MSSLSEVHLSGLLAIPKYTSIHHFQEFDDHPNRVCLRTL